MKICFYCTTGKDFNTYDFKVIYKFNFKDYVVKVLEINDLSDLLEFRDKINSELVLTDSSNVIHPNKGKEVYSIDFIKIFTNKYPYAIEIYDYYRE